MDTININEFPTEGRDSVGTSGTQKEVVVKLSSFMRKKKLVDMCQVSGQDSLCLGTSNWKDTVGQIHNTLEGLFIPSV